MALDSFVMQDAWQEGLSIHWVINNVGGGCILVLYKDLLQRLAWRPFDSCWSCRGFQLLAKMGYKPGQGIGAGGGGRVAPVEVDLKSSRAGLGVDEAKKRQRDTAKAQQAERGAEDEPPAMTIM